MFYNPKGMFVRVCHISEECGFFLMRVYNCFRNRFCEKTEMGQIKISVYFVCLKFRSPAKNLVILLVHN